MFAKLQSRIGYKFKDEAKLRLALTHRSVTNETDELAHNERLEFLGDTIVDFVLSDLLYAYYPDATEGELSQLRATAVRETSLAAKSRELHIGEAMRLGEGERKSGGANRESLLADTYEAIVAAIYLDGGLNAAIDFVRRGFAADIGQLTADDSKTELQHISQREHGTVPAYRIIGESGPQHARVFTAEVSIGGRVVGVGEGVNKKRAEQAAARVALTSVQRSKEEHT